MKLLPNQILTFLFPLFFHCHPIFADAAIPDDIQKVMHQPKYDHAIWGLYVKDLQTDEIIVNLHSDLFFSPASTSKLFTISALLNTFGDNYRFKTPVYATGNTTDGKLEGNLILVAQGDLTFGGRQPSSDKISYTKLDHTIANEVPGAILTKENPLQAIDSLANQIYSYGIRELSGDVIIDDRLFESTEKRGTAITPIMINENLIDIALNPSSIGQPAQLIWRPQVTGYTVENRVKTVNGQEPLSLEITADETGQHIIVTGSLPENQHNIVRTSPIKDPKSFARIALIDALKKQGIKLNIQNTTTQNNLPASYKDLSEIAQWTSPPLIEYAKLILKVSHNLGANLTPLLLAAKQGEKTFDEGMRLIGKFITEKVQIAPEDFVMVDGAGGNENRFTPQGEIQLLGYVHQLSKEQFENFRNALPILGVDGSLEDFAKNTKAVGKVYAKPGTGVSFSVATGKYFLITQALSGYIEGKNGHLLSYMVVVNNAKMPTIDDVFAIFEDVSLISSQIYSLTEK